MDHSLTKGALKFKEEIEKKHGDEVEIVIYSLGKLGNGREALEGMQSGTIEMAYASMPWTASFSDAFSPLSMPYLFLNREIAFRILDGEMGKRLIDRFEKQAGIKFLGFWENGIRHTTNSKRPIKKPEDYNGIKIRVQQDPVNLATFKAMGANPTPMALSEIFTALQQGVIDAQENPVANIYQLNFHEVQKYFSTTAHVYDASGCYMSMELFDKLSPEFQKDVIEAAQAAKEVQRKEAAEQDDFYMQKLVDYGKMEITLLSTDDLAPFKEAVRPVYKEVEDLIGRKDKEWAKIVPELLTEAAKIEAEVLKK
jgi:tripartite ATP-independent transporter DctP family solute receptor